MADPATPQTLIDASGGANDYSVQILSYVFGTPLSGVGITGAPAGPGAVFFDQFFLTLNSALFGLGVLWFAYSVMSATVHTANEGQFLGKRYSSFWFTIRGVIGFSSLVPVFNGWSLIQLAMYAFTIMGIGLANLLVGGFGGTGLTSAVDGTMIAKSYAAEQLAQTNTPPSAEAVRMAETILRGEMCAGARNGSISAGAGVEAGVTSEAITCRADTANGISYRCGQTFMGRIDKTCGGFDLAVPSATGDFRMSSMATVDVAAINNQRAAQVQNMVITMRGVAGTVYTEHVQGVKNTVDFRKVIEEAAKKYDLAMAQAVQSQLTNAQAGANQAMKEATNGKGWIGIGTSYQRISKQMSDISVSLGARPSIIEPSGSGVGEALGFVNEDQALMQARMDGAYKNDDQGKMTDFGDGNDDWISKIFTPITNGALNTIASLGSGSSSSHVVNPVVYSQQLGDYIINGTVGALFTWGAINSAAGVAEGAAKGVGDSIVGFFGGGVIAKGVVGGVTALLAAVSPFVTLGIAALFVFGIVLSVYIPLIPFITWWSAVIQWFVVVAESIVASPLLAFAHLDADGEGLGQRTQYGYVFAINVLLRPALMVMAFVVATIACIILGTMLLELFKIAIPEANAQSMIGPIKFLGLLSVFMSLTLALVHTSFGMTSLITDQVLAWIGGHATSALGAQHDREAGSVFVGGYVSHAQQAAAGSPRALKEFAESNAAKRSTQAKAGGGPGD